MELPIFGLAGLISDLTVEPLRHKGLALEVKTLDNLTQLKGTGKYVHKDGMLEDPDLLLNYSKRLLCYLGSLPPARQSEMLANVHLDRKV